MNKLKLAMLFFWVAMASTSMAGVNTIKIGILDDMSGPYSAVQGPGDVLAAKMAAEDFGGKVLGRPIEVLSGDHQNKSDVGTSIARRWYDVDEVDAIMGLGNSAVALGVQELTREKNKINITTSGGTAQLTGTSCSSNGFHWVYDTYSLAKGTVKAVSSRGGKTWFFVTPDYAFGRAMQDEATKMIEAGGGKVIGSVRHPVGAMDFSSFILQAQGSKAEVIGLANAGADLTNTVKAAAEFGIVGKGQTLAGTIVLLMDVHSLGLKAAQGLVYTEAFYWDQNDKTREFSKRFEARHGVPPTSLQAGTYSAVMHYLKAIEAAGTDQTSAVLAKIRQLPVNDFMTTNGRVREDGRMMRDMYLMEVKKPEESNGKWDLLKVVATISADDAFRPLSEGGCPLVGR